MDNLDKTHKDFIVDAKVAVLFFEKVFLSCETDEQRRLVIEWSRQAFINSVYKSFKNGEYYKKKFGKIWFIYYIVDIARVARSGVLRKSFSIFKDFENRKLTSLIDQSIQDRSVKTMDECYAD